MLNSGHDAFGEGSPVDRLDRSSHVFWETIDLQTSLRIETRHPAARRIIVRVICQLKLDHSLGRPMTKYDVFDADQIPPKSAPAING
jgi:hypothetical protein